MTGAVAFAAASLFAAYASSVGMLIAARALLGIAGATLMPSTLSLISNMFRDVEQRRFAIAVWMTNFSIGGMVGPLIGGVFLEHFWYGSIFLLGVPVGLVLLIAGPLLLPEYRDPAAGRLDLISMALSIATVLPVVYGFKQVAQDGLRGLPLLAVATGLCVGVLFVRRQLRLTHPMLDLRLFSRPAFGVSLGGQTMGLFVLTGTQFLVLLYFQLVLGLSPLAAGLWALPAMTAGVVGALLAPLVANRKSPAWVMAVGFALAIPGLALVAQADTETGLVVTTTGFAITSFGIQAALALTNDVIISSVPPQRAGNAAGVGETGAELGNALGVAVAGSIATAVYRSELDHGSLPEGIRPDLADAAGATLGSAIDVAGRLPERLGNELPLAQSAFTDGIRVAAFVSIGILVALTAASLTLLRREADYIDSKEHNPESSKVVEDSH